MTPKASVVHTVIKVGGGLLGCAAVLFERVAAALAAAGEAHRILVVAIDHPECPGIRVTPNVYTTLEEIDRFSDSLESIILKGMPA